MSKQTYDEVTNGKSRGRGKSKGDPVPSVQFEYVNINLSEGDKEQIAATEFDAVRALDWLCALAVDGYKVSVSHHSETDCYIVSVTSTRKTNEDYNRCVTSRSNDSDKAWLTAMYKFEVLLMGGRIPPPAERHVGSVWD